MIKAKLLAMCVCPAIATPPAILAVHAPARYAVAHLLHRTAARLDHGTPVAKLASAPAAALPCTPSLDGAGGGLPVTGGDLIGGGDGFTVASAAQAGGLPDGGGGFGGSSGDSGGFVGGSSGSGPSGGGVTGGMVSGSGGLPGSSSGPNNVGSMGGTVGGGDLPLLPGGLSPVLPGSGYPSSLPSPVSGAPEPTTWAFLVIGFGLVGAVSRRDRRVIAGAAEG